MEALRLTGGNLPRALDIVVEAVKSGRQPGESREQYTAEAQRPTQPGVRPCEQQGCGS
jgi:hypothetical protein